MRLFGQQLWFFRRTPRASIHSGIILYEGDERVIRTGCDKVWALESIAERLIARSPNKLPGRQIFCKVCGARHGKIAEAHGGHWTGTSWDF